MISNRTIRQWFRNQINDASAFDLDDFAWENDQFDGTNKEVYYRERMVVTNEFTSDNEGDGVKWGIMFLDVIAEKGSGSEVSEDNAKTIADIFEPANNKDVVIESGLKIDIDIATSMAFADFDQEGVTNRSMLPVRIEFRAYECTV